MYARFCLTPPPLPLLLWTYISRNWIPFDHEIARWLLWWLSGFLPLCSSAKIQTVHVCSGNVNVLLFSYNIFSTKEKKLSWPHMNSTTLFSSFCKQYLAASLEQRLLQLNWGNWGICSVRYTEVNCLLSDICWVFCPCATCNIPFSFFGDLALGKRISAPCG